MQSKPVSRNVPSLLAWAAAKNITHNSCQDSKIGFIPPHVKDSSNHCPALSEKKTAIDYKEFAFFPQN